ncbi:MAG: hypothetical protein KAI81_07025 [Candidatus Marinimicrobia bacterium]|nr:hypothetical protein [Candidatus Neomarinimicrobiota bacterium]
MKKNRILITVLIFLLSLPVWSQVRYPGLINRNNIYVKRANGQAYSGEMIDNFSNGKVKVKGQLDKGLMEGEWLYYHENGSIWGQGNFVGGNGKNPSPISGIPKDGRNGIWKFYYESGKISSEYHYERGRQNGAQKEWFANEVMKSTHDLDTEREQTWFSNGQRRYDNDPRNDLYREWFRNGQEKIVRHNSEGIVREWYQNGDLRKKGLIRDNLKEGEWIYYRPGKILDKKIFYEQGEKTAELKVDKNESSLSQWKKYYPNGRVKEAGQIITLKKQGIWTVYYLNGRVKEKGNYLDNRRDGLWQTYNEKNILIREEYYMVGKYHGKYIIYFNNGDEKITGNYNNGQKSDKWTYNFENGDSKAGHYHNDMKIGPWNFYSADGSTMTIVFMDDKPIRPEPN